MSETIQFEVDQGVGIIRLNRPEHMNSLTKEMMVALMDAAIQCDEDPNVRAALLTGNGKAFCAGADLKGFLEQEALGPFVKELTVYLHAAVSRLVRMDAPLVVAVNGTAAGGGFSLSLLGDVSLASKSAMYTMAYTASGLSPDGSSTFFLPRLVGLRRARHLAITNRRLKAEEALEWGLTDELAEDDELFDKALSIAQGLASGATAAFGSAKRLLIDSYNTGLETQMEMEAREVTMNATGADVAEGIAAFIEKRRPAFKGKR